MTNQLLKSAKQSLRNTQATRNQPAHKNKSGTGHQAGPTEVATPTEEAAAEGKKPVNRLVETVDPPTVLAEIAGLTQAAPMEVEENVL